jgi:AcrR family transcriptional regulator
VPAPQISREEVLDRIIAEFRSRGYDGATLARLAAATGLVKASLYHYFPKGKEDMARATLAAMSQQFADAVLAPMAGCTDPHAKLCAMTVGLDQFYQQGRASCILEIFSIGTARELFGDQIRATFIRLRDAIAGVVAESGLDLATALSRAELAVAAVQGSLVMSRGLSEPGTFTKILKSLPDLLLASAPNAPST